MRFPTFEEKYALLSGFSIKMTRGLTRRMETVSRVILSFNLNQTTRVIIIWS